MDGPGFRSDGRFICLTFYRLNRHRYWFLIIQFILHIITDGLIIHAIVLCVLVVYTVTMVGNRNVIDGYGHVKVQFR